MAESWERGERWGALLRGGEEADWDEIRKGLFLPLPTNSRQDDLQRNIDSVNL